MAPWDEDIKHESTVFMTPAVIAYLSILCTALVMSFVIMCVKMAHLGQKTRNPQQRRMFVGSQPRQSLTPQEPTIYVSPSNLPPPPKYECMAPPSYEEVVGIHYPNYQIQPITQPINAALAQAQGSSNPAPEVTSSVVNETNTPVVVPTEQRRASVART